jgi:hypothetical protein
VAAAACLLAIGAAACGGEPEPVDNSALMARMQYLNNLADVAWLDFDGGDVYVGFSGRPPDLAEIVNSAVVVGAKAHGNRVHIYAVDGGQPGWREGDGPLLCEASMHMGRMGKACL